MKVTLDHDDRWMMPIKHASLLKVIIHHRMIHLAQKIVHVADDGGVLAQLAIPRVQIEPRPMSRHAELLGPRFILSKDIDDVLIFVDAAPFIRLDSHFEIPKEDVIIEMTERERCMFMDLVEKLLQYARETLPLVQKHQIELPSIGGEIQVSPTWILDQIHAIVVENQSPNAVFKPLIDQYVSDLSQTAIMKRLYELAHQWESQILNMDEQFLFEHGPDILPFLPNGDKIQKVWQDIPPKKQRKIKKAIKMLYETCRDVQQQQ